LKKIFKKRTEIQFTFQRYQRTSSYNWKSC